MDALEPLQRIAALATSKRWMYFEVRNTLKHRAHKEAYRLIAENFVQQGIEVDLCRMILQNITYEDWEKGKRVNLWEVVADREKGIAVRSNVKIIDGEK